MATQSLSRNCLRICTSEAPNAARAFLKLAPTRRHLSNFAPPPLLDFLLPPSRCLFARAGKPTRSSRRTFTSSATRQHTSAIHNPQKDEDGNEMHIEITPRASNRLKEIMAKDSNPSLALRIQVESGGCHGFQYLMSLTTLPSLPISSSTIPLEAPQALNTSSSDPNAMPPGSAVEKGVLGEDDTVFEAEDGSGAKVVMDGPSLDLLKGSKVDFTMELIGSQFKIVDNPLATSSCGCGTSFDIKA
ncbi:Iron-sulfur cluster assembly 2-like protein, mitochondrial [Lachnellula hyalina]|uniref:Iron-sulfur cluster assembly 2-like protein, mitochondrial n=1 Tax=Lachnellula hyalina TaxID=1316788 RepID=A0A8H8R7K7_9HELO|nr:Iron-sulfur cluster assembly 2-like protein, mitochondrial [Lachnellula hyalina]TVY29010.1 Iron-sulfur cluster assembly 2-like protein, mitochondrial [Lachnellula hyalina]